MNGGGCKTVYIVLDVGVDVNMFNGSQWIVDLTSKYVFLNFKNIKITNVLDPVTVLQFL